MIRIALRRVMPALALAYAILAAGGCGHEAPVYQPGSIFVTSEPAGATILLDGQETALVTPDTLTGLEPGSYLISVDLAGYPVSPAVRTVTVSPLRTSTPGTFALSQTTLSVTSDPPGASIIIDGEATGEVTPAILVGSFDEGHTHVSLELEGYLVTPEVFTVMIEEGEANEVPADTFTLRSRHTVLFEGFSNVACQGCPDMAENMENVKHRDGYGSDRVLYVKYSMSWPSSTDPFYQHNIPENTDRLNYYFNDLISGIPVLEMEGVKVTGSAANSTPTPDEIVAYASTALERDPGFLLDVSADFSGTSVPVEVTITALEDVSLAGKTLAVVLVQTYVHDEDVSDVEGGHEFHDLFRDRADNVDALLDLSAEQTQTISTTVERLDWDLDTMQVIAFVQDDADKSILQAGSTGQTQEAPAHLFHNLSRNTRIITSGGE
jgi:hypothetical protein